MGERMIKQLSLSIKLLESTDAAKGEVRGRLMGISIFSGRFNKSSELIITRKSIHLETELRGRYEYH